MNVTEVKADKRKFCRKLRLIEYFSDRQETESIDIVKPESTFTPPKNRVPVLDTYTDFLTKYPLEELAEKQSRVKDNLTKAEWNGIKELKNNSNIVIKESDKGGACVIMDAEVYDKKNVGNDKRRKH